MIGGRGGAKGGGGINGGKGGSVGGGISLLARVKLVTYTKDGAEAYPLVAPMSATSHEPVGCTPAGTGSESENTPSSTSAYSTPPDSHTRTDVHCVA